MKLYEIKETKYRFKNVLKNLLIEYTLCIKDKEIFYEEKQKNEISQLNKRTYKK